MYFCLSQRLKVLLMTMSIVIIFMPTFSFAASTLVIDEFQIAGKTAYDEYLIITNTSESPVSLSGYKVMKYTATGSGSNLYSAFGEYVLQPNARLMLCQTAFTGTKLADSFVYSSSVSMAPNNSIALIDNKGTVVDLVGFGTNATLPIKYAEGEAIEPSPIAYQVLKRSNGIDTDNNNMDFSVVTEPMIIDVNADKLIISELLPSPATGEEWFELYNPTNVAISLANLKICDAVGSRHCYYFEKTDFLSGGSYKIYGAALTKMTLNNSGDWLELYDANDNLLTDSGGDYGAADKGISLSVFGTEYRWTASLTPGSKNVFTDTVEVEVETAVKPKTTTSKVVAKKKTVVTAGTSSEESPELVSAEAAVKAAETKNPIVNIQKALFDKKTLGWALIGLAILLVVGYTLWYFRDYAKEIYHKIRPGDDSARF
jgi:hypothetical protein